MHSIAFPWNAFQEEMLPLAHPRTGASGTEVLSHHPNFLPASPLHRSLFTSYAHSKSRSGIFFTWQCFCGARFLFYFLFLVNIHLTSLSNVFSCNHLKDIIQTSMCFLFPFCITLKGHICWHNSCREWISSFAEVLFQPKPNLLQVVEKGAFASQVGDFLSLHNAYSLKWNPIGHIGIVVHAVSHYLALRWQGEVL